RTWRATSVHIAATNRTHSGLAGRSMQPRNSAFLFLPASPCRLPFVRPRTRARRPPPRMVLMLRHSPTSPEDSSRYLRINRRRRRAAVPLTNDDQIADLLAQARTIAIIGASDRPDRPSYGVMGFLQDWGYRVFPVNPQITGEHVHGEFVWRELAQIG